MKSGNGMSANIQWIKDGLVKIDKDLKKLSDSIESHSQRISVLETLHQKRNYYLEIFLAVCAIVATLFAASLKFLG